MEDLKQVFPVELPIVVERRTKIEKFLFPKIVFPFKQRFTFFSEDGASVYMTKNKYLHTLTMC
jgi:hypothetical protein